MSWSSYDSESRHARARAVELLADADAAHALVERSPPAAAARARAIAEEARRLNAFEAVVAALHALGYAQYQMADPHALGTLRQAVRIAVQRSLPVRAAYARRLLAGIYADRGNVRSAIREIEQSCAGVRGADLARSQIVRLAVFTNIGREPIDLSFAASALTALRRQSDVVWEARLLQNRGLVLWNRGDPRAEQDLRRAQELWRSVEADAAAALVDVLLMRVALSRDDVVGALTTYSAIDRSRLADRIRAVIEVDGGKIFLAARLFDEARQAVQRAERVLRRAQTDAGVLEERFELARLLLAVGDRTPARRAARAIQKSATAHGNPVMSLRAQMLALAAVDRATRSNVISAMRNAEALDAVGRRDDANRARLIAIRLALAVRKRDAAEQLLLELQQDWRRLTLITKIEWCALEARARMTRGDAAAGRRALRRGLGLLERHRGRFGDPELRATASGIGVELTQIGIDIGMREGSVREVLEWAESLRSTSTNAPLHAPSDQAIVALQVELRRTNSRLQDLDRRNLPRRGLASRQTELEDAIRARSRTARGTNQAARSSRLALSDARRALGRRTLVEYIESDGELYAVTLDDRSLRLHRLGSVDPTADLEWLRFGLRRIAHGQLNAAARDAAVSSVSVAAASLERRLVEPLRDAIGGQQLVIVPTGALHALPWAALPSLRGTPFTVSPSLKSWSEARKRSSSAEGRVVLVAGPRLRHARSEATSLARQHRNPTVLTSKAATVEATLAALDGARLAHIACHGRFRSDNPLFSSLELADGPLTALDLQRLRRAPELIVLSACDVALSERHPGDELLGFAAALLAAGTKTIVASVVPVPDAAARRLMLAFHRHLLAGVTPAAALAAAQSELRGARAALAGFVCLGAG